MQRFHPPFIHFPQRKHFTKLKDNFTTTILTSIQLIKVCFHHHRSFPDSSVGKEPACDAGDPIPFLGWKDPQRKDRLPTPVFLGFHYASAGKESACNVGDLGSIPGLGRSPREGKGYALQYSGLENSMDCTVHGVTKSQTRLSAFQFHSITTRIPHAVL